MKAETQESISYAIREAAKYLATYGVGYAIGTLIPINGMRYKEMGHLIGGAATLIRAYISERRQK